MREPFYRDFAEGAGGARYSGSGSFENSADLEDIIQDLFGGRGGKVTVPTLQGSVMMTVPRRSTTGAVLRLKGKGVPRADGAAGDQYVRLEIALPPDADDALESAVTGWEERHPFDPRAKLLREIGG